VFFPARGALGRASLIAHGAEKIAKYLIAEKIDVKHNPEDKENALTATCYTKTLEPPYQKLSTDPRIEAGVKIAMILITMIDINSQNRDGNTPLHLAVSFDFYKMAAFLFEKNASLDKKNNENETPFSQITLCESVPPERKKILDLYLSRVLAEVGIFKCLHPIIQEYVHEEDVHRYDLGEMGYDRDRHDLVG
jgi:hypothetical protein